MRLVSLSFASRRRRRVEQRAIILQRNRHAVDLSNDLDLDRQVSLPGGPMTANIGKGLDKNDLGQDYAIVGRGSKILQVNPDPVHELEKGLVGGGKGPALGGPSVHQDAGSPEPPSPKISWGNLRPSASNL